MGRSKSAAGMPCAKLVQNAPYGRVDVCGEPEGHGGPHRGMHRGMVWETYRAGGRTKNNIIDQGTDLPGDRVAAGKELREIPRRQIDRGAYDYRGRHRKPETETYRPLHRAPGAHRAAD